MHVTNYLLYHLQSIAYLPTYLYLKLKSCVTAQLAYIFSNMGNFKTSGTSMSSRQISEGLKGNRTGNFSLISMSRVCNK